VLANLAGETVGATTRLSDVDSRADLDRLAGSSGRRIRPLTA